MNENRIVLGSKVCDLNSDFEGLVVARIEYYNGVDSYGVQPERTQKMIDEGKLADVIWFERLRLAVKVNI